MKSLLVGGLFLLGCAACSADEGVGPRGGSKLSTADVNSVAQRHNGTGSAEDGDNEINAAVEGKDLITFGTNRMKTGESPFGASNDGETESANKLRDYVIDNDDDLLDKEKCLVAISGIEVGHHAHGGRYPGTKSGGPLAHGETFDNYGGTYVAPRDEPYRFGVGGKELDQAVRHGFGSIAVPPGMAVLAKDHRDNKMFEVEGPIFLYSNDYEDMKMAFYKTQLENIVKHLLNKQDLPSWMVSALTIKGGPAMRTLTEVRHLQISKIKGRPCEIE